MSEDDFDPFDTKAQQATADFDDVVKQLRRDQEVHDFRTLMGLKEGRRFVYRLLQLTGVYRTSFSTEALLMAFNEGNRNLGLLLLGEINEMCPKRYGQMQKEHEDDERRLGNARPG